MSGSISKFRPGQVTARDVPESSAAAQGLGNSGAPAKDPLHAMGYEAKARHKKTKAADQTLASAGVIALTSLLDATAIEAAARGLTSKVIGRLKVVEKSFEEATRPDRLELAGPCVSDLTERVMEWLELLRDLLPGKKHVPEELLRLQALMERRFPECLEQMRLREAQELVLPDRSIEMAQFLEENLAPSTRRLTIWHDGGLSKAAIDSLLSTASAHHLLELTLLNAENGRSLSISPAPSGGLATESLELAALAPKELEWTVTCPPEALGPHLAAAGRAQLVNVTMTMDLTAGLRGGSSPRDVILEVLNAKPAPENLRLLLPDGKVLLERVGVSLFVADPEQLVDKTEDFARELVQLALATPQIHNFSIGSWGGFQRGSSGLSFREGADKRVHRSTVVTSELLAHHALFEAPLEQRPLGGPLARCFADAIRHSHASRFETPISFEVGQSIAASISHLLGDEPVAALLGDVLQRIEQYSEAHHQEGFGLPALANQAREGNAFALLRALHKAAGSGATRQLLLEMRDLLGPTADRCVLLGAPIKMLYEARWSKQEERRRSAGNELKRFRDLRADAIQATELETAGRYEVAALPDDRAQGEARSTTPDFLLRRISGPVTQSIFVDAKEMAADYLSNKSEQLDHGLHQILEHRFRSAGRRQGLLAIHVSCTQKSLSSLVESVQAQIRRLARPADHGEAWVRLTATTETGEVELNFDPRNNWELAKSSGSLVELLGWVEA